ncbi:ROK family protein [Microaceticoccus formicicus]|uniref:ROK family protein n=1 Tax=Microaceticoccus formicicus TaxID=3118105 RepID=UPI003CD02ADC|nr:ROK family protein [Peptoniphilaceae bacterium AMB_02]
MNILALDIGGTYIKYGLFNNNLIESGETKSEGSRGGHYIVKNVDSIIEKYKDNYELQGVAISSAGVVDIESGTIIHAGNTIPNYKGFNWKKHIMEKYGLDCEIDNDVNCAALGEYSFGAAKDKDAVLMLAVGTGIGGAFIKDGIIYRGSNYTAMEVGYMKMEGGCFQDISSTSALVSLYREKTGNLEADGRYIFRCAKAGEREAIETIDRIMNNLCMGIANITFILDPKVVLLGGGIMEQREYLEPIIRKYLKEHMLPLTYEKVEIEFAKAGNLAASYGALHHYKTRKGINHGVL